VSEVARSGTPIAQASVTFAVSEAATDNWFKQDCLDRTEEIQLSRAAVKLLVTVSTTAPSERQV
jgi:hypothetical protein